MPTACLNEPRARVRLSSERLIVQGPDPEGSGREVELRQMPLRDLDRVIAIESVQFTSEALGALLRADVPITFLSYN
ncbi:MAG: CRISPR-associated endonuclease Cas1, partial [Roseimicrobium sp.]